MGWSTLAQPCSRLILRSHLSCIVTLCSYQVPFHAPVGPQSEKLTLSRPV